LLGWRSGTALRLVLGLRYSIETDLPSIALANKKNETVIDCRTGKTHEEQVMEEAEV
jgi:hypothetical protein